jgi:predicted HTH domain antitoxin
MHVRIDISQEAEDALRREWGDLDQAAKDALLIESYRAGKISLGFLAELMGVSRWEAEQWLGRRGVTWNYGLDDLESDRKTLAELFGDKG